MLQIYKPRTLCELLGNHTRTTTMIVMFKLYKMSQCNLIRNDNKHILLY